MILVTIVLVRRRRAWLKSVSFLLLSLLIDLSAGGLVLDSLASVVAGILVVVAVAVAVVFSEERVRLNSTATSEAFLMRIPSAFRFRRNAILLPTLLIVVLDLTNLKPRLPPPICLTRILFRPAAGTSVFFFAFSVRFGNI